MAEVETQEFLSLSNVIESLALTDTAEERLLPMIQQANRQVSLLLVPVLDIRKLDDTEYWQDAMNLAMLYFQALFERRINHNHDEGNNYHKEYMQNLKTLVAAIKADPDRSKRTVLAYAGADTNTRLLRNIPSMTDRYGRYRDRYF